MSLFHRFLMLVALLAAAVPEAFPSVHHAVPEAFPSDSPVPEASPSGPAPVPEAFPSGPHPDVLPMGGDREIGEALPPEYSRFRRLMFVARAEGPTMADRVICFANALCNTPYEAHTLEVNDEESLVVNLHAFDCTTYIENVIALALCMDKGSRAYDDFCDTLRTLRYRDGKLNGYASRNHYFTEWIDSNTRLGIVSEVKGNARDKRGAYYPFSAVQRLTCNYMSQHPDQYPMMRDKPSVQQLIRDGEQRLTGRTVRYIPKRLLGGTRKELACIHDGDILAIVTNKKGLDTSHLGIAVWQGDELHMFHASQLKRQVMLDPTPLKEYMEQHPSQLGVRVVRLCR